MNCLNCQKLTKNPKFCSRSCAVKVNNKKYIKRKKGSKFLRKCTRCLTEYKTTTVHRSKVLCTICVKSHRNLQAEISKNITLGEVRNSLAVKNKHPSWLHSRVRANNKSWNKNLSNIPCQKCAYSLHVELCHIRNITSFPDSATLGEVNDPLNILVLCRNCHWEFDNGHLDLVNIPPR